MIRQKGESKEERGRMRWVRGEEEELFFPAVLPAKLKSWHLSPMCRARGQERRGPAPLSATRNEEMSFGSCDYQVYPQPAGFIHYKPSKYALAQLASSPHRSSCNGGGCYISEREMSARRLRHAQPCSARVRLAQTACAHLSLSFIAVSAIARADRRSADWPRGCSRGREA